MKTQFISLTCCSLILMIFGCKSDIELPQPKIFKGLKLGIDIDSAINIINETVCYKDLKPSDFILYQTDSDSWPVQISENDKRDFCQYKITDEIFAKPNIFNAKFKGNKIVGSATLLFHSPKSFPYIEVKEYNGTYKYPGMPAITSYQTEELLEMFDAQYGKRIKSKARADYSWAADNLIISMYKAKYDQFIFLGDTVLTLGAYQVTVTYRYTDDKFKLIELEKKTKSGENVGDKV